MIAARCRLPARPIGRTPVTEPAQDSAAHRSRRPLADIRAIVQRSDARILHFARHRQDVDAIWLCDEVPVCLGHWPTCFNEIRLWRHCYTGGGDLSGRVASADR